MTLIICTTSNKPDMLSLLAILPPLSVSCVAIIQFNNSTECRQRLTVHHNSAPIIYNVRLSLACSNLHQQQWNKLHSTYLLWRVCNYSTDNPISEYNFISNAWLRNPKRYEYQQAAYFRLLRNTVHNDIYVFWQHIAIFLSIDNYVDIYSNWPSLHWRYGVKVCHSNVNTSMQYNIL